jgi:hypothetical protein
MLVRTDDHPTDLGYYMVDQRATGMNVEMGPVSIGRPLLECATYTCTHCQRIVMMTTERTRPRYKCYGCAHLICDPCAAEKVEKYGGRCVTFAQQLDEANNREARQASGVGSSLILPTI